MQKIKGEALDSQGNQLLIRTHEATYFLSYEETVAIIPHKGKTILFRDWDKSATTLKYLHKCINSSNREETRHMLETSQYIYGEFL